MLEWSTPISEWVFYWLLIFSVALVAGVPLSSMKRKNKVIFASIGVVLLLICPFIHRLEVKKLIYEDGYRLIVHDEREIWTQEQFIEVEPDEYLNKLAFSFDVNHENKLVFIDRTKFSIAPRAMENITFKSKNEE